MPRSISSPLILVTRPEPSASETAAALRAAGYRTLVSPALVATAVKPYALDLPKATVLIVTSPQAARFLRGWTDLHQHKVLAVGTRTAALLKTAGFMRIIDAGGDAAAILGLTAKAKPQSYCLLGAPSTGRSLSIALQAQGHRAQRVSVYRVAPAKQLMAEAKAALTKGAVTHMLLYSARTAESFLALTPDVNFRPVTALCLSAKVAKAVRKGGFVAIRVATRPTSEALQRLLPALDSLDD